MTIAKINEKQNDFKNEKTIKGFFLFLFNLIKMQFL